ncbi:MAG: formate/nitrite transporter family protein [Thermodesulfobacteriota bacterium]|nr:formate/nitrite transporter family protein [Thermodesulfobacteriota bacterium]
MSENHKKIVLPNGQDASVQDEEHVTERSIERQEEEEEYQSVIVKRTDEIQRHPDDMISFAVTEGLEQHNRPPLSLLMSSIAAGLVICFTAMAVAIVTKESSSSSSDLVRRLAPALVYPLGFIACIISGTQLFTEHTASAVYPVLDKKATFSNLIRLWILVIFGNLIGVTLSASLLVAVDDIVQAHEGYIKIAEHLVDVDFIPLFISALLAGWLMALGSWLLLATHNVSGKVVLIYLVTFLIGLGGLHHSIAGSAEMLIALFISDSYTFNQAIRFIFIALAGNLVGGSIFVAALNYIHIRRTQVISP